MIRSLVGHFIGSLLLGLCLRLLGLSWGDIARKYNPKKRLEGTFVPGAPLRDITQEELAQMPKHVRLSVDSCGFYNKPGKPTSKPASKPTSKPGQPRKLSQPKQERPQQANGETKLEEAPGIKTDQSRQETT